MPSITVYCTPGFTTDPKNPPKKFNEKKTGGKFPPKKNEQKKMGGFFHPKNSSEKKMGGFFSGYISGYSGLVVYLIACCFYSGLVIVISRVLSSLRL